MHAYRGRGDPEDFGDFPSSVTGVVVEHDGRPLPDRQQGQGRNQFGRPLRHLVRLLTLSPGGDGLATALQLAGCDPERDAPDPRQRITEALAAAEGLREGLGYRVTGHLSVAREREHRPPETI